MAEYPIHPYIIHCLEPLLANAAAPVVLALDGRRGSGKTTMAAALASSFRTASSCTPTISTCRPPTVCPAGNKRPVPIWTLPACGTRCWPRPRRKARALPGLLLPGGCLSARAAACRTAAGDPGGQLQPPPLLAPYEDFRVFMTCSDAEQTRRLQAREGDRYPDFAARWIPLEEAYFTQHNIEDAADFVMDTTTD